LKHFRIDLYNIIKQIHNMKSIKGILAGIGAATIMVVMFLSLTAATAPTPYSNLTKVTSRDGITVYHYGDCVIVKTNNSISITR
jgi:hypothetical protein